MTTVTLQIANLEEVKRRARNAFAGKREGSRISFSTPQLLFKLLTAKRWELIRSLCGAGPVTIREAARRAGLDVKAVHGDVHALLDAGILHFGCPYFSSITIAPGSDTPILEQGKSASRHTETER